MSPGYMFRGVRVALGGGSNGLFEVSRYPPGCTSKATRRLPARRSSRPRRQHLHEPLDRFAMHVGDDVDLETPTGRLTLPIVGVVPDYMLIVEASS